MLTISAMLADGEVRSLPAAVYIELCRDENVPADSLRVIFSQRIEEELAEIYIASEGEEIFCGVVDEQIFISSHTEKTEVVARSMGGVLLDNEACPHNFVNPCTGVLFERYMLPFGITDFLGEDKALQGKFDVTKGSSCWQVAEAFGRQVFGRKPEVRGRTIVFTDTKEKEVAVFSNDGEGIPFEELRHSRLRCKLISTIRAKTDATGDYSTVVSNDAAKSSGVTRERYIDVSSFSGDTLLKAFEAIEKSKVNSQVFTLKCPMQLVSLLSAKATVRSSYGVYENLSVKSLRYVMNQNDEYTRITLCRKET